MSIETGNGKEEMIVNGKRQEKNTGNDIKNQVVLLNITSKFAIRGIRDKFKYVLVNNNS